MHKFLNAPTLLTVLSTEEKFILCIIYDGCTSNQDILWRWCAYDFKISTHWNAI